MTMCELAVRPAWLAACAVLLCALAGAGVLPGMMLAARAKARSAKRSAYDRCARQLAHLGLFFGLVAACVGGGLVYAGVYGLGLDMAAMLPPLPERVTAMLPLVPVLGGLLAVGGLCGAALRLCAARPGAVSFLAVAAELCLWVFWLGAVAMLLYAHTGYGVAHEATPDSAGAWFALFGGTLAAFPLFGSLTLLGLFLLGLAASGGFALVVQILRRGVDDYGRDYYMLAAGWCAAWAGVGGAGLTLGCAAVLARIVSAHPGSPLWVYAAVCLACALVPCLCWFGLARSENPLRWKALMVLAALCLLALPAAVLELSAVWHRLA